MRLAFLSLAVAAQGARIAAQQVEDAPLSVTPYLKSASPGQLADLGGRKLHVLCMGPEALRQVGGYGELGSKPLIVIRRAKTANPPSEAGMNWQMLQRSLLVLSTCSDLIVAGNAF